MSGIGENEGHEGQKRQRIRELIDEVVRRREAGEELSDDSLIQAHPDLMPELAQGLHKLRIIEAARREAEKREPAALDKKPEAVGPTEDDREPTAEDGGHREPAVLHIRCPHCRNPVEIVADDPLTHITCRTCGSTFSLVGREGETRTTPPVKTVGHFDLTEPLGTGAFGTVWKARDTELDRTVAVKIPRTSQLSAEDAERFFREARAAAQLRHPNIVSIHEVGREGDHLFIVSDLVRGATLTEWLAVHRPTPREAAELCLKVAGALHHAHESGVIHRDLKPSNIMLDMDGEPHVMDFGLAKREVGEITMTVEGKVLGTPAYMSPEQAKGEAHKADRRSDVYSLGVILYQLLTGELPFRGEMQMLFVQIERDEPPGPRKLNSRIPRDLDTICLKCLEKAPEGRYPSACELAEDLQRFLSGQPIRARRISPAGRFWRFYRRDPLGVMVPAFYALGLVVLLFSVVMWQHLSAQERQLIQTRFEVDAENRVRSIERQLRKDLEVLSYLQAFYMGSEEVSRQDFRRYVERALPRSVNLQTDTHIQTDIQTLWWIPHVTAYERAEFEHAARQDGYPDYEITEMTPRGRLVRAGQRDEYFPAYFVEPYKRNRTVMGFDHASESVRHQALRRARDTGGAAVSGRISLVLENAQQYGVLVCAPVYQKHEETETLEQRQDNLVGWVAITLRIDLMVERALSYFDSVGMEIEIVDRSAPPDQRLLYVHAADGPAPLTPAAESQAAAPAEMSHEVTLEIPDRMWLIRCTPTDEHGPQWRTSPGSSTFVLAIAGIFSLILLAAAILLSFRSR